MEPSLTPDDTAFAPAARVGEEVLAWQRNAFLSDPTAIALLEAMPGPTMVLNRQRQIIASNMQLQVMFSPSECEHLIGRRPGEALGCVHSQERKTGCGTTPACENCGAVNAILESLATHGRVVKECRVRTTFRTKQGALDLRVYASYAEIGGEEMVVFALMDISSEKRREILEQTLLRDQFAECQDRDLLADHLHKEDVTPEDEAAFRQEFGDLSRRVLEQIESHRLLLAAESGEVEPVAEEINLRALLEKRIAACQQAQVGHKRAVELRLVGHESLRTDPVQLGRIVDGLLRNALEATPEGGRVDVTGVHDGGGVTIAVRNAGVMPPEVQAQIFQRSFSTKHGEGRGIGTYSVKLLVERFLQGSVEFVSDELHGTVFSINVPDRAPESRAA